MMLFLSGLFEPDCVFFLAPTLLVMADLVFWFLLVWPYVHSCPNPPDFQVGRYLFPNQYRYSYLAIYQVHVPLYISHVAPRTYKTATLIRNLQALNQNYPIFTAISFMMLYLFNINNFNMVVLAGFFQIKLVKIVNGHRVTCSQGCVARECVNGKEPQIQN